MHIEIVNENYSIESIMNIYEGARYFMRKNNNPNQWKNWPTKEIIEDDIKNRRLHLVLESNTICGVFAMYKDPQKEYKTIKDGEWLNNNPYITLHRVASSFAKKGFLEFTVCFLLNYYHDIRIDTHIDNYVMQNALIKLGFKRCGAVTLDIGEPREAYHLHHE